MVTRVQPSEFGCTRDCAAQFVDSIVYRMEPERAFADGGMAKTDTVVCDVFDGV
jgi:hypothetical protein